MDLSDPKAATMPKLVLDERDIQHIRVLEGVDRVHLPISPSQLKSSKAEEFDIIRLWTALHYSGWGSSHPTQQTARLLNSASWWKKVAVNSVHPSIIKIYLQMSKMDQYGKGEDIYLGRTGSDLCLVSALLTYSSMRGNQPGPLFRLKDGRLLTKDLFIVKVRLVLSVLGYTKSSYAGHSFRIGAATTAVEHSIEDSVMKMLGWWKRSADQQYARASQKVLDSVSRRLVMTDKVIMLLV